MKSTKQKKNLQKKLNKEGKNTGRWTKEEHKRFVDALRIYGKNWKKVEEHVQTRTGAQIRSHAQKFFNRLYKEFNLTKQDIFNNLAMLDHANFDTKMDGSITKKKNSGSRKKKKSLKEPLQKPESELDFNFFSAAEILEKQLDNISKQIDASIKSIPENEEPKKHKQINSWKELITGIMEITQKFLKELNRDNPRSTRIYSYDNFLKDLGRKLEMLSSFSDCEVTLGKRPHSFSEDNIRTELVNIPSLYDIVKIAKKSKGDIDTNTTARTRKPSFIIHEESEEKIEKLKRLKKGDFHVPASGRKRIMSLNL